jgi:hypothetical protein
MPGTLAHTPERAPTTTSTPSYSVPALRFSMDFITDHIKEEHENDYTAFC